MNFTPRQLDDCYEYPGIQGMFLDDHGFPRGSDLHNFPDFQGGLSQIILEIMFNLNPGVCLPCPLYGFKMK